MNREEAMEAFIESGMELRRDDIELGRQLERKRILEELTKLTDSFNRGESDANMVMYLYRFIEARSKDTEKLDLQIDIKGEQK